MRRHAILIGLSIAIAACSREPAYSPDAPPVVPPESVPDQRLGRLSPQQLRQGECGLFLWARQTGNKLVLFARSEDDFARMALDGAERKMRRTRASGRDIFGQFERQRFAHDDVDLTVEVAFTPEPQGVVGGALIRRATLTLVQPDAWRVVVPVAGLIACR